MKPLNLPNDERIHTAPQFMKTCGKEVSKKCPFICQKVYFLTLTEKDTNSTLLNVDMLNADSLAKAFFL